MRNQQSGFTLVEIAIVLVIIGLLLGGVLKGQELINSAKVKNMANDFRNIATFVYAYQDKFRAMPGDDPSADTHLSGGTVATAITAGDLGNSRINGAWNSVTTTNESFLFWQHVRLAALATGPTTFGDAAALAAYIPRNAEGGRIGITSEPVIVGGNFPGSFFICSVMQGRFARQLDATIDDGNTATGSLRAIALTEKATEALAAVPNNLTPNEDANLYTVCMGN